MHQIAPKSPAATSDENPYGASQVTPPEPEEHVTVVDWVVAVVMILFFWTFLVAVAFPLLYGALWYLASVISQ